MVVEQKGFSLVELMIVVAIIGVLTAVAIPQYQIYVAKSEVNRAVSELGGYRSGFESKVSEGLSVSNESLGYMASSLTDGDASNPIASVNPDGSGHLEVTMGDKALPFLAGVIIRFNRTAQGVWSCSLDKAAASHWRDAYRPQGCQML